MLPLSIPLLSNAASSHRPVETTAVQNEEGLSFTEVMSEDQARPDDDRLPADEEHNQGSDTDHVDPDAKGSDLKLSSDTPNKNLEMEVSEDTGDGFDVAPEETDEAETEVSDSISKKPVAQALDENIGRNIFEIQNVTAIPTAASKEIPHDIVVHKTSGDLGKVELANLVQQGDKPAAVTNANNAENTVTKVSTSTVAVEIVASQKAPLFDKTQTVSVKPAVVIADTDPVVAQQTSLSYDKNNGSIVQKTADVVSSGMVKVQVLEANATSKREEIVAETRIKIREPNSPVATPVRAQTHPVQAILHSQLPSSIQTVAAQFTAEALKDKNLNLKDGSAGIELPSEIRSQSYSSTTLAPSARVDVPQPVSRQVTDAIRTLQKGGRMVEVALSPAELGNVRMTMAVSETGMTVVVLADRPETLELLKRNIGDLKQSFEDMGHDSVSFSFEQQDQQQDSASQDNGVPTRSVSYEESEPSITIEKPAHAPLSHTSTGVDIRL